MLACVATSYGPVSVSVTSRCIYNETRRPTVVQISATQTQTHTVNYRVGQSGRSPWLQVIASLPWFPPVDVAPEGGGDQVERDPGVRGTPMSAGPR